MKNLVLGLVLSAFIFTAVPVHAQVVIPTDRAAIIALIEILLKRIEEVKAEMVKADKKASIAEENRVAKENKERQRKEDRLAVVSERIIRMDGFGMECTVISYRLDDKIKTPEGNDWKNSNKRECEIAWATELSDLKVEKTKLKSELK